MALTNAQYDHIMRKYEARQRKRHFLLQQRMVELYSKDPRLEELDALISSASVKRGRMLLDGDACALRSLKKEIEAFRAQKADIIMQLAYPADYLDPPYHCRDCMDNGYIDGEKCHCFKQEAIDLVYTQSNMRKILEQENFDHFSYDYYSEDDISKSNGTSSLERVTGAMRECKRFIQNFDQSFGNLCFYGDTGVGKTFLSNCVAKELLDSGHSVIYFTAFELFSIFEKNTFRRDVDVSETGDYRNLFVCDLLMIDDLGTEFSNTFTSSRLFECLNERILRRKSTIISTNLNMEELRDFYSERIFSRISSNYTMIKLTGPDIRIQKKLGGRIHA